MITFQDPSSLSMDKIIDFHHDIFFFLIVVSVLVCWFLIVIFVLSRPAYDWSPRSLLSSISHRIDIEIIWTLIPIAVLMLISVPSFGLLYYGEASKKPDLIIKVIGNQWWWKYEYLTISQKFQLQLESKIWLDNGILLLESWPKFYLPVFSYIKLLITSIDVLHSWTVPAIGVKIDACPGRINEVGFRVYRTGFFFGQCSEICGVYHGFMPITVNVVEAYEFFQILLCLLIVRN